MDDDVLTPDDFSLFFNQPPSDLMCLIDCDLAMKTISSEGNTETRHELLLLLQVAWWFANSSSCYE